MSNLDHRPLSKDRSSKLAENVFGPVLDGPLAVYQKSAQSEQLNGTTFLGSRLSR